MLVVRYNHEFHGDQTIRCKELIRKNGSLYVKNVHGVVIQMLNPNRILSVKVDEQHADLAQKGDSAMDLNATDTDDKNNKGKVPDCCDFCGEKKDNLFVKPSLMKVNGKLVASVQKGTLWICLDCFGFEFEEF